MIVTKLKSEQSAEEFGLELAKFFGITADKDGRYATDWGTKTATGLARCVERMYRERVFGTDEAHPEGTVLYVADQDVAEGVWPK